MPTPVVWKTPGEVRAWVESVQHLGQRIALVPTMGFLHEGHLSLMREGAARADVVAVPEARLLLQRYLGPALEGTSARSPQSPLRGVR